MKLAWTLAGLLAALMALAACGGGATPPRPDCMELTDEGMVPTPCPTNDLTVTVSPESPPPPPPPPPPACPTDESPETLGCGLFLNVPESVGAQPLWCYQCHLIEDVSEGLIGPELTHIGTDAATRKEGFTAEQYIRESIRDPEVFIPDGVVRNLPGLMTKAIVGDLTDDEVDKLVAFLLTLK